MLQRARVHRARVEAGFQGLQARQAAHARVDEDDVVFEDGVGVGRVTKIDGDVGERGFDAWVDFGVGDERQQMFSRAKNKRVETVVQAQSLGAHEVAGIQKGPRVVLRRSRWA